jgi:hypothetical protein
VSAPILLVPAPGVAIVPLGFEVIPILPRREAAERFPMVEARRAAAGLALGGRVVVIIGRYVAQALLARGVWADVDLRAWSRATRPDEDGVLRPMRYVVLPHTAADAATEQDSRLMAEALTIADRIHLDTERAA